MNNVNKFKIVFLIQSLLLCMINCFNLSPVPNIVIKEPSNLKLFKPKERSSYFGLSINLRQNSIIIGAPRTQPTRESEQKFNETGAVYNCLLDSKTTNCEIMNFLNENKLAKGKSGKAELKDYQWFGGSMDGGSLENDPFVVCAPRMMFNESAYYSMQGMCYWMPNTTTSTKTAQQLLIPNLRDTKLMMKQNNIWYMLMEQGCSIHMIASMKEVLIGAPGFNNWQGNVMKSTVKKETLNYDVINRMLDLKLWKQPRDTYFGYAVTSGYFDGTNKVFNVASMPRLGEVLIFDTTKHNDENISIVKLYTFSGEQTGEYFGYNLVCEDFNADGFDDLAISAPFYSKEGNYGMHENGAVYIYENLGESSRLKFSLKSKLTSAFSKSGRFGTTISKIGDINQDGFNDLAVGAPYENNGAIYIYLGGSNGLVENPVQKIRAPENKGDSSLSHLFGNGLSRGVDIDSNQYLDIAIGAPNSEVVYIYKSYPVVKIKADITPDRVVINTTNTLVNLTACWSLQSRHEIKNYINMNFIIKVDGLFGRATFQESKNNHIKFNRTVTAVNSASCDNFEVVIQYSDQFVFEPIAIEMHYKTVDVVPENSQDFCENCVTVHPNDLNVTKSEIIFNTDCINTVCEVDLELSSVVLNKRDYYILGTDNSISLSYSIKNTGERAFLPQINISIGDLVTFKTIPSTCKIVINDLICKIRTLPKDSHENLTVTIDLTKLEETKLMIKANVYSLGRDKNGLDNYKIDIIELAKCSDVEILSQSSKTELALKKTSKMEYITQIFEIKNNGPSSIKQTEIVVAIPITYRHQGKLTKDNIIQIENITIKAEYNAKQYSVELEHSIAKELQISLLTKNSTFDDKVRAGLNEMCMDSDKVHEDLTFRNLPINRTILFDCNALHVECVQGTVFVPNFEAGHMAIIINLTFSIDTQRIYRILTTKQDIFALRTFAAILNTANESRNFISTTKMYPYIIMRKFETLKASWMVYFCSVIFGILTLLLLTYGLYKMGFFKREKKEAIRMLSRQASQNMQMETHNDNEGLTED